MRRLPAVLALAIFLPVAADARPRTVTAFTAGSIDDSETTGAAEPRATGPDRPLRPMTENEKQGAGCLVSSLVSTGITYSVGAVELAQVIAGGTLAPSSPAILFLAVTGTITLAACGMGAILAPTVVWAYEESDVLARIARETVDGWMGGGPPQALVDN